MGILSYISDKKKAFNETKEAYQNKRMKHNQEESARLNNERLKIEEVNKSKREYKEEKYKLQEAKKERFNNSLAGEAVKGIEAFVKSHQIKDSGKGFRGFRGKKSSSTASSNRSNFGFGERNPFGASFGNQNDTPTIEKKSNRRETVIIVRR